MVVGLADLTTLERGRARKPTGFDLAGAARSIQADLTWSNAQAADRFEMETRLKHADWLSAFLGRTDTLRPAGLACGRSGGDGTEVFTGTKRQGRGKRPNARAVLTGPTAARR